MPIEFHGSFRILRAGILAALLLAGLPADAQKPPAARPASTRKPAVRRDAARFHARAQSILNDPRAAKAFFGAVIEDAETGTVLYELNADRYFIPASNAKLFTTAAALSVLGPGYRFHTTLETRGSLGPDGVLRGDLVLVGRGDPDLSNRKVPFQQTNGYEGLEEKVLVEMVDQLAARGVREVTGDVVADDSYFPFEPYPPGWAIDDVPYDYGAAVSAIAIHDNIVNVQILPGEREGQPATASFEPWAGYYTFENKIVTGPRGSETKLDFTRGLGSRRITLTGSIALEAQPKQMLVGIDAPAEFAAALLAHLLADRGIKVDGVPRAQHEALPASGSLAVLAEHLSPPLIESVRVTNKVSQNLHAEMLLRAIGQQKMGMGSTSAGLEYEQQLLLSAGIIEGDVMLTDGSGLSRRDLVTPRAVAALLRWVSSQPWGADYISTLPVAGEDGTLLERFRGTTAANRIEAKTGAVEHARSLSGFATTLTGERLVFSFFTGNNALRGRDSVFALDSLAVAMVEELGVKPKPVPAHPASRRIH